MVVKCLSLGVGSEMASRPVDLSIGCINPMVPLQHHDISVVPPSKGQGLTRHHHHHRRHLSLQQVNNAKARKPSCFRNRQKFNKDGGFLEFQATHPSLCDHPTASPSAAPNTLLTTTDKDSVSSNNQISAALTCMSQPCMPVSNIGPTKVLPHLYLGSQHDALSQDAMQVNDITYVLNVSTSCKFPSFLCDTHLFRIPVNDNYSDKLLPHFQEAFQFLDKVKEGNGRVLIHCLAGISRSATLAIAYVMKTLNYNVDDAYRYVKDKRPTISPNFNFMGQLLEYEKLLKQEQNSTEVSPESASFKRQCLAELRSPTSPTTVMPKMYDFRAKVANCAAQSPTTAFANLSFAQAVAALPSACAASEPADSSTFPQLPTTSLDSLNFTPCLVKDDADQPRLGGGTKRPRSAHVQNSKDKMSLNLGYSFCDKNIDNSVTMRSKKSDQHNPRRPTIRPNSIAFSSYPAFELPDLKETQKEHEPSPTTPINSLKSGVQITTPVSKIDTPPTLKSITPNITGKTWSTARKSPPDQLSIPCRYGPITATASAMSVRKSRSMEDIVTTPEGIQQSNNDPVTAVPLRLVNKPITDVFGPQNNLDSDRSPLRQSSGSISSSGSHNSLHGSLELIQVS